MATPNYLFPEIAEGQASKHLTHNESVRMIEVALGSSAQSPNANTPPTNPIEGTLYILGSAPTGVWAGKANNLALRVNGFWLFVPPNTDINPIYSKTDNKFYRYDGAAWVEVVLSASGTSNTRQTISFTTGSLAPNAKLDFGVTIGKRFDVLAINTSVAAWVRIYPTTAYRTVDTNRLINETPSNDFVAVVDVVNTASSLTTLIIDNAAYSNMENTPLSLAPCTVVNTSDASSAITINFTVVIKEA